MDDYECLKLHQLSHYASDIVFSMRVRMRKFTLVFSQDLMSEYKAAILIITWISLGLWYICSRLRTKRRNNQKLERGKLRSLDIQSKVKSIKLVVKMLDNKGRRGLGEARVHNLWIVFQILSRLVIVTFRRQLF